MHAEARDEHETKPPGDRQPIWHTKKRCFRPHLLVPDDAKSNFYKTADECANDKKIFFVLVILHKKDKKTDNNNECGECELAEPARGLGDEKYERSNDGYAEFRWYI